MSDHSLPAASTSAGSATTLLVTLTGRDRPGVTSRLFGALAAHPLSVPPASERRGQP